MKRVWATMLCAAFIGCAPIPDEKEIISDFKRMIEDNPPNMASYKIVETFRGDGDPYGFVRYIVFDMDVKADTTPTTGWFKNMRLRANVTYRDCTMEIVYDRPGDDWLITSYGLVDETHYSWMKGKCLDRR